MVADMQRPAFVRGIRKVFESTPEDLGASAVAAALKEIRMAPATVHRATKPTAKRKRKGQPTASGWKLKALEREFDALVARMHTPTYRRAARAIETLPLPDILLRKAPTNKSTKPHKR